MPNMDGTGPDGKGPMSGGRKGRCRNTGTGKNNLDNGVKSGAGKGNVPRGGGKGNCSGGWGKKSPNGSGQGNQ